MRNLPATLPPAKAPSSRAATELGRFRRLNDDIVAYRKVCDCYSADEIISEEKLRDCKAMIRELNALRERWAEVDRPATSDEIATQIVLLTASFPNQTRADLNLFAQ